MLFRLLLGLSLVFNLLVKLGYAESQTFAPSSSPSAISDANPISPDYFDLERQKIFRWNDQTRYIMVYIADGSYLPGWNPENPERVKAAFYEWEQAMSPRFHFIFMPDERGSDVKVFWTPTLDHTAAGEEAGLNEYQTWDKYFCKNDIKLTLMHHNGRIYSPNLIQSVALHEIGHMLGLKAHSNFPGDVMYPSTAVGDYSQVQHLSQRDINTMRLVYQSKPNYTNPEGYHLANFNQFKKTQHGHRITMMWVPVPGVPFPVPIILPF